MAGSGPNDPLKIFANIFISFIGAGVLGLPYAFKRVRSSNRPDILSRWLSGIWPVRIKVSGRILSSIRLDIDFSIFRLLPVRTHLLRTFAKVPWRETRDV